MKIAVLPHNAPLSRWLQLISVEFVFDHQDAYVLERANLGVVGHAFQNSRIW